MVWQEARCVNGLTREERPGPGHGRSRPRDPGATGSGPLDGDHAGPVRGTAPVRGSIGPGPEQPSGESPGGQAGSEEPFGAPQVLGDPLGGEVAAPDGP